MRRRSRRRSGFTLIEVMVSLGVMMVGAMAVIGLQAHSIRGNGHARRVTTATEIAQRWIERMKQDSATWNTIGVGSGAIATALVGTTYLGQNLSEMSAAPDDFRTLTTNFTTTGVSNAFDSRGRDQEADGTQAFCVSYRPAWVWEGHLMRLTMRVFWPRRVTRPDETQPFFGESGASEFASCADTAGLIDPDGAQQNWYHAVYLTTAIRVNEVRR